MAGVCKRLQGANLRAITQPLARNKTVTTALTLASTLYFKVLHRYVSHDVSKTSFSTNSRRSFTNDDKRKRVSVNVVTTNRLIHFQYVANANELELLFAKIENLKGKSLHRIIQILSSVT